MNLRMRSKTWSTVKLKNYYWKNMLNNRDNREFLELTKEGIRDELSGMMQLMEIIRDEVNVHEVIISCGIDKDTGNRIGLAWNGTFFYWRYGQETRPVLDESNVIKIVRVFLNSYKEKKDVRSKL